MPSFNKVYLMGNLTRDPQLKYLPSQTAVCEFGLACNRKFKTQTGEQKEEVLFVEVAAFGNVADVINRFFTKGKPIFIEGRLKYDQWEDKQGGGKRSKLSVVMDTFQFIGGKDDAQGGGGGGHASGGGNFEPDMDSAPPPRQNRPPMSRPMSGGGSNSGEMPSNMPSNMPPSRPAPRQPEPPPYSEDQQVKDDDIPF